MNMETRLASFLEQMQGRECCDQCVMEKVTRQEADSLELMDIRESAWVLAESSDFHRSLGKCSFCKEVKIVTRVC
ncbi:hypothetical protein [Candidatus Nitronereus thalassa]|uniref:Uncharacterized protein n=1 Tax=Candidatus Nitronereus thalassa TaxID=3020898 RepID=A0ABU3K753_9BACT|nr:hypothetical protein [Candidatus Nitronereus thalassa]MDT7042213.1 hypothetical protein [Candidatus Nitronereus thalassa]